jgi:hypothetical protein
MFSKRDSKQREEVKIKRMLNPAYPNQFGVTALADSDLNRKVLKGLSPHSTIGNQNFRWRTVIDYGFFTQVALADTNIAIAVQLSDFNGYADFTSCFDQYRLNAVAITFTPSSGMPSSSTLITIPRLWTVIDYDDGSTIARTAISQYESCIVTPAGCGVTRVCIPRQAIAVYQPSAFTGYGNVAGVWNDSASPNTDWFGFKAVLEQGLTGQTDLYQYSTEITAFWEFRSTR